MEEETQEKQETQQTIQHEHKERDRKETEQKPKTSFLAWLRNKFEEYRRVLRVTKKPDGEEFKVIFKVSGIGMIIIGLIGFLITLTKQLLFT